METIYRYIIILLIIILIISIILAVYYYMANDYCINNENNNCPNYTCPQINNTPGVPAYRIASDGSTQCSSKSDAGTTGPYCSPGS